MSSLDNWFKENNLVINLKKGKTEYVLYGTSQKLKKKSNTNCNINGYNINQTHSYKYLGVTLDNKINLIDHFHKTYKKASGRIRLLKRIRHNISPSTAASIYQMMIQPIIFYCNNILVNIPDSHAKKFQYIQDRAKLIINNNEITSKWKNIQHRRKQLCVIEVFKTLNGLTPSQLNKFETFSHEYKTRGNKTKLKLPKVKSENGRKMFNFIGAKIYNELPSSLTSETSLVIFKSKTRDHF